ncbi:hypothetical protein BD413DRAFT_607668 [Trametes elegans]|nr:hypothetical protein BD413DRAFT_607668 [Trametes elegans]
MGNTYEDWTRVPTTAGALFGIELPYRPPKNALGAFLWRRRFWLETTSGLSLLEPWEKILVLAIFYLLLTLVFTGLYKFVPQQAPLLYHRLLYYFFGNDDPAAHAHAVASASTAVSARHFAGVADWIQHNVSHEL